MNKKSPPSGSVKYDRTTDSYDIFDGTSWLPVQPQQEETYTISEIEERYFNGMDISEVINVLRKHNPEYFV